MRYITGIHALNLNCSLDTPGDWHQSALNWKKIRLNESEDSLFGVYGLEVHDDVPENTGEFIVANHIRALLDLLVEGNFAVAQGMNEYYIGNPKYNNDIFSKVLKMKKLPHWERIKHFMFLEYGAEWVEELGYADEEFHIYELENNQIFSKEFLDGLSILEVERLIQKKCVTVGHWYLKINNLIDLVRLYELYKNDISKEIVNIMVDTLEQVQLDRIKWILENSKEKKYDVDKVMNDLEVFYDEIGLRMEK